MILSDLVTYKSNLILLRSDSCVLFLTQPTCIVQKQITSDFYHKQMKDCVLLLSATIPSLFQMYEYNHRPSTRLSSLLHLSNLFTLSTRRVNEVTQPKKRVEQSQNYSIGALGLLLYSYI